MTIEIIIKDDSGQEVVHELRSTPIQPFRWNAPYEKPLTVVDMNGRYKLFGFVYQPTAILFPKGPEEK